MKYFPSVLNRMLISEFWNTTGHDTKKGFLQSNEKCRIENCWPDFFTARCLTMHCDSLRDVYSTWCAQSAQSSFFPFSSLFMQLLDKRIWEMLYQKSYPVFLLIQNQSLYLKHTDCAIHFYLNLTDVTKGHCHVLFCLEILINGTRCGGSSIKLFICGVRGWAHKLKLDFFSF